MIVNAVLGSAAPQPQTANAATSKNGLIDSDFETFLKMLTTQLKNQDPLDPIDNSDYAVQLATFSGVEQQVKTNDLLTALGSQFGVVGMSQLAGWVGKQARAEMPVQFDGLPVSLAVTPDARADAAQLVVTDSTGKVVARDQVPPGKNAFDWAGTDPQGAPLPSGRCRSRAMHKAS
jgi:flagellar basal-body rod modification protein FlgD